jgi:Secretion system C-terminal sorting domain
MNYKLLLSSSFIALSLSAAAQSAATYAITGDNIQGNTDFNWMNIRKVDVATGKMVSTVFDRFNSNSQLLDAVTKQPIAARPVNSGAVQSSTQNPTATLVAAAAFDKRHNKLFFTPMRIGQLRWIDFDNNNGAGKFYTLTNNLLNNGNLSDEANHITRMDIAADGNGYAVTNDGNHFIRFTTGKKTVITDLGALLDAESNKGLSIHNRCTSWGGDMVADAYGKLYIISANHTVFKIDIDSRTATYTGVISGLPANYSTNGAAVDNDGKVVVSSANSYDGLYKFDMKDLAAVKIEGSDKYTASDLANGNLLYQKEVDAKRNAGVTAELPAAPINTDARIFPNPVTNNEFKVLFDNQPAGQYYISVADLSGRDVFTTKTNVSAKMQALTVRIANTIGKGVYFVKVLDASKQLVFTERVVVQ